MCAKVKIDLLHNISISRGSLILKYFKHFTLVCILIIIFLCTKNVTALSAQLFLHTQNLC